MSYAVADFCTPSSTLTEDDIVQLVEKNWSGTGEGLRFRVRQQKQNSKSGARTHHAAITPQTKSIRVAGLEIRQSRPTKKFQ